MDVEKITYVFGILHKMKSRAKSEKSKKATPRRKPLFIKYKQICNV